MTKQLNRMGRTFSSVHWELSLWPLGCESDIPTTQMNITSTPAGSVVLNNMAFCLAHCASAKSSIKQPVNSKYYISIHILFLGSTL